VKFYDCTIAPSPRRVRIFLAEKGVRIETVQVDLMTAENLNPSFLAINPRGVVPVLELDDGTRIDEAVSICRYIEDTHPEPPLMGTDPKSRALIDSRTRHMEFDGFLAVANVFRNSTPGFAKRGLPGITEEVPAIPALVDRGFAGITRYFGMLERYLEDSEYIAGDRFTIADITALCVVDFAGWVKRSIPADHVRTKRWHEAVSSRPSAKA
jgi:glutathione S-transferase